MTAHAVVRRPEHHCSGEERRSTYVTGRDVNGRYVSPARRGSPGCPSPSTRSPGSTKAVRSAPQQPRRSRGGRSRCLRTTAGHRVVFHPFTALILSPRCGSARTPIVRGEGCTLWDAQGKVTLPETTITPLSSGDIAELPPRAAQVRRQGTRRFDRPDRVSGTHGHSWLGGSPGRSRK